MKVSQIFSTRQSVLVGFSKWFLLFSLLLRIVFFIWQLADLNLSVISCFKILGIGFFFDIGVLSFLFVLSNTYLLIIPKKWIGNILDKFFIYSGTAITLLIFVFTFFAEITFWEEFKCRFNFVAVDYLIYTFEVVQNIHESYPLYILIPSMIFISAIIYYYFYKKEFFSQTFNHKVAFKNRFFHLIISIIVMLFYVSFVSNSNAEWSKNRYNNEISKAGIYSFFAELRNNKLDFKTFYNSISDELAFQLVRNNLKEENARFLANEFSIKRKIKDSFLKNTTLFLFFFTLISCSVRLFGQDTISQSARQSPTLTTFKSYVDSEIIRHKWDVSVNLLDLIGKGNNVSLFLRKNYVNRNNESRAFRLRIMPYFLSAHSVGVKRSVPTVGLFFAPGYEWQQRSGRFMLFYGMDIRFKYDYSKLKTQEEMLAIYEKAKAKGMNVSLIEDEGRTVFNGVTTITCVGIGPASRAAIDIITGHLKCY